MRRAVLLIALLSARGAPAFPQPPPAAEAPSFAYDIQAGPDGYRMEIEMVFSRGIGLERVAANFRDDQLLHELYGNAEPGKTVAVAAAPGAPAGERRYDRELVIRNFGLRTRMLSHCRENSGPGLWARVCELDLAAFDGGARMKSKHESARCEQPGPLDPVRCRLSVSGAIKPFWWIISAERLTVKAKEQALINWGRFWYYTQNGSASAQLSNEVFDHSRLARGIDEFTREGLRALKGPAPFALAVHERFEGPAAR